jgi:hypothetical protein
VRDPVGVLCGASASSPFEWAESDSGVSPAVSVTVRPSAFFCSSVPPFPEFSEDDPVWFSDDGDVLPESEGFDAEAEEEEDAALFSDEGEVEEDELSETDPAVPEEAVPPVSLFPASGAGVAEADGAAVPASPAPEDVDEAAVSPAWLVPVTAGEEDDTVVSSAETVSADGAAAADAMTSAVTIIPSFFLM